MKDLESVGPRNIPREIARRARVQYRAHIRILRAYQDLLTAAAMLERSGHASAPYFTNAGTVNAAAARVALLIEPAAVAAIGQIVEAQVSQ